MKLTGDFGPLTISEPNYLIEQTKQKVSKLSKYIETILSQAGGRALVPILDSIVLSLTNMLVSLDGIVSLFPNVPLIALCQH